jgi:hypothetical protein
MKWSPKNIESLIRQTEISAIKDNNISLLNFDLEKNTGVGIDGFNRVCLILPSQKNALGFSTKFVSFDPSTSVYWDKLDSNLDDISILRCKIDLSDEVEVKTIGTVLAGLIDVQQRFGSSGDVIWALKALFEDGFKSNYSMEKLIGLIGEILVIVNHPNPAQLVKIWHTDVNDRYDFSYNNFRLEVKTTTSSFRNHYVTSSQLPPEDGTQIFFASILLQKVESGESFFSLYETLIKNLNLDEQIKVDSIILETLGVLPVMVTFPFFDFSSSKLSIKFYDGAQIPFPTMPVEILSASCLISFDSCSNLESDNNIFSNMLLN